MSRLDRHISTVQTRMTLSVWLRALAWAGMVYAIIVWAAILIDKLVQIHLPRQMVWFWVGLGVTIAASMVYAIWRRPGRQQAAIAIDDKLALKEKFSTALYVRPSKDPFALAALQDAERTADKVNLQNQFPVKVPKAVGGTALAAFLVFLTAWLLPTFDLFGVQASRVAKTQVAEQEQRQAREAVRQAIAEIQEAPKAVADKTEIQLAKKELLAMSGKPTLDPDRAKSTAQKAEQDVQQAIKEKIQQNKDYAVTQQEMQEFKNMTPPADETGPIADSHRDMAQGKLDQAVEDLSKAVNNFDKMSKQDQDKTAKQMKNLANAIQQMANNPKAQQQIKDQLQQMGANQQQAQQMMNMMKQAAAGNPQAAQQLKQAAKQLAQQMNQKSNASPQQQRQMAQQIQQAMQQMQQKVNTQINAQQLAQSAQALAQAMQQSAQGGGPGQSQQAKSGQASSAKSQQGNQSGQQGQGQQMANAAKQMQQQLQQMQAIANDAQEVAAGQQNAGQNGNGNQGGQNGNNGQGQKHGNNPGQWANAAGPNAGGVGKGNNRPAPQVAPYQVKDETDISQKDEKGRVLASTFVKAGSIKGDAKMQLHDVLPSVQKDATDEIDEQRIPRQDQDVVRGYFGNLERDTEQK